MTMKTGISSRKHKQPKWGAPNFQHSPMLQLPSKENTSCTVSTIPKLHDKYHIIYQDISVDIWQCVKTLLPLVNIKIAGKWMFIPLKMVLIGIDPYPYINRYTSTLWECPSLSSQPELLSHNAGH